MMKTKLPALILVGILLFTGCASRGSGTAVDVVPADAATTLLEELTFPEELLSAEGGAVDSYYKLDDTIEDFAIYISGSGGTANEIAVLKVADPADLEGAKAMLTRRVDNLKTQFQDYVPAEMVKLNDPVIVTGGKVAILVLSDDSAGARKAVEALLG